MLSASETASYDRCKHEMMQEPPAWLSTLSVEGEILRPQNILPQQSDACLPSYLRHKI